MVPLPCVFALFLLVPVAEVVLFIVVGSRIGVPLTAALVVLTALIGAGLVTRQGRATLEEARNELAAGTVPARQLAHGVMILIAGALLLTPGFLTDAVGFGLLIPAVRGSIAPFRFAAISAGRHDHPVIAKARPAATVCLVRDAVGGIEVLMVQRGPGARVMADAWVFPGGIVDEIDGAPLAREAVAGEFDDGELPWVAAAMRETVEEVDIWLTSPPVLSPDGSRRRGVAVFRSALDLGTRFDGGRLAYFANWVTPTMIPLRFDTRFYAAEAGAPGVPAPDPSELAAAEWIAPRLALAQSEATERLVPFPTRKILALIGGFSQVAAFMKHIEEMGEVMPVRARGPRPRGWHDRNGSSR